MSINNSKASTMLVPLVVPLPPNIVTSKPESGMWQHPHTDMIELGMHLVTLKNQIKKHHCSVYQPLAVFYCCLIVLC